MPADARSGNGWAWSDQAGAVVVTGAGVTLSGLDVTGGGINVEANNVTISNVRITNGGDTWGIGLYHSQSVHIVHTEIRSTAASGPGRLEVGIKDIYGDVTGTVVSTTNIWHTDTGVQFNNGTIADSYIHDLALNDGDHINGTTSNAGSPNQLTISHNTILNKYGQTDAISLFEDFGAQHNALITGNLVAGGGYTIYGGANSGGAPTSHIVITNNRISTVYFPNGGSYGPVAAFDPDGSGNTWSGNSWIDGPRAGAAIGPHGS